MARAERNPSWTTPAAWGRNLAVMTLYTVAVVGAWEFAVRYFDIADYLLPAPSAIYDAVRDQWPGLLRNSSVTLAEIVLGFLAGTGLGAFFATLIGAVPPLRITLLPTLVALQSVPKVAFAPLMVVWLGLGLGPKVAMAALFSLFPVLINTHAGLTKIDPCLVELVQVMKASEWQSFLKIRLPHALPSAFDGMKIAMPLAVVGAIVGEFTSAERGLGNLILTTSTQLKIALMFGAIVAVTVIAVALYGVLRVLERLAVPWSTESRDG